MLLEQSSDHHLPGCNAWPVLQRTNSLKRLFPLTFCILRVKFWNVRYLEEMDYNKTKKPGILPKTAFRSKSKKQQLMKESEHQLPSSSRSNVKEFFSGFKED